MVKMKDVAKLANVSTATVSRVLTNANTVSETTKQRVLESIEKLNYQPNIIARSFRKMEQKQYLSLYQILQIRFFQGYFAELNLLLRKKVIKF